MMFRCTVFATAASEAALSEVLARLLPDEDVEIETRDDPRRATLPGGARPGVLSMATC